MSDFETNTTNEAGEVQNAWTEAFPQEQQPEKPTEETSEVPAAIEQDAVKDNEKWMVFSEGWSKDVNLINDVAEKLQGVIDPVKFHEALLLQTRHEMARDKAIKIATEGKRLFGKLIGADAKACQEEWMRSRNDGVEMGKLLYGDQYVYDKPMLARDEPETQPIDIVKFLSQNNENMDAETLTAVTEAVSAQKRLNEDFDNFEAGILSLPGRGLYEK